MNDLTVTVTGWVATAPTLHDLGTKGKMCTFRMAHTSRYRNNEGEWVDGATEWFSVRMFRTGAQNVSESIHKGDPVIVRGRVRTSTWTNNEGVERTELQLDARTVGHDLTKGVGRFSRQSDGAVVVEVEVADATAPASEVEPDEPAYTDGELADVELEVREREAAVA